MDNSLTPNQQRREDNLLMYVAQNTPLTQELVEGLRKIAKTAPAARTRLKAMGILLKAQIDVQKHYDYVNGVREQNLKDKGLAASPAVQSTYIQLNHLSDEQLEALKSEDVVRRALEATPPPEVS